MRTPAIALLGFALLSTLAATARADSVPRQPVSHLSGRVIDSRHGTPVEGALVLVAGSTGVESELTTGANGAFATDLRPGDYYLIFIYGTARSATKVELRPAARLRITGKVDSTEGEVIEIRDKVRPPVPPKPTNYKPMKAPPYSDKALVQDAWTKAWMLLDIDETGALRRIKWLKRPGYDLEPIAIAEVKKLTFRPARDASGTPIRAWLVWGIEWPSAWWLDKFVGTRAGMPPIGPGGRRKDDYVPCAGSGPWHMGSLYKTYKDCSRPDLRVAEREPWFTP